MIFFGSCRCGEGVLTQRSGSGGGGGGRRRRQAAAVIRSVDITSSHAAMRRCAFCVRRAARFLRCREGNIPFISRPNVFMCVLFRLLTECVSAVSVYVSGWLRGCVLVGVVHACAHARKRHLSQGIYKWHTRPRPPADPPAAAVERICRRPPEERAQSPEAAPPRACGAVFFSETKQHWSQN